MRQSACLVFNLIIVDNYAASLIARRWVGRQTLLWPQLNAIYLSWLGPELGPMGCFSFAPVSVIYLTSKGPAKPV